MPPSTWVMTRLDGARRRLRLGLASPAPPAPEDVRDHAVSIVRPDLERLMTALAASLEPGLPRPDSPDRLAAALIRAIERCGGHGVATVTRTPAGVYSPEYWHIRVAAADATGRDAVTRLVAGQRVA